MDHDADLRDLCRATFTGDMAGYAGRIAVGPHRDAIAAASLADAQVLDALLVRFGRAYPGADARAAASYWSQHYFAGLMPLVLLCLAAGRPIGLDLATLAVRFCPTHGTPLCLHVGGGGPARTGEALFRDLIDGHVDALTTMLARHCGLSSRMLWENAGWYVTFIAGQVARGDASSSALARRLLDDDTWPSAGFGFPHLKRAALRGEPPVRRLCCLRVCLPMVDRCLGACPWPPSRAGHGDGEPVPDRGARAEADAPIPHLRRKHGL